MPNDTREKMLVFSITATKTDKQRIDKAAHDAGLPRTTFIRRVVKMYLANLEPAQDDRALS